MRQNSRTTAFATVGSRTRTLHSLFGEPFDELIPAGAGRVELNRDASIRMPLSSTKTHTVFLATVQIQDMTLLPLTRVSPKTQDLPVSAGTRVSNRESCGNPAVHFKNLWETVEARGCRWPQVGIQNKELR